MKGLFVVVSFLCALIQLSVVPKMPGFGIFLNILMPFLLVGSWYFGLWGVAAAFIVSVFEVSYTSLSPFFMILSLVLPCALVMLATSTVLALHPSQKPFSYGAMIIVMASAMLLHIILRGVTREGGFMDMRSLLAEGFGILFITHLLVRIIVAWYGKNIPKPFFYKRV